MQQLEARTALDRTDRVQMEAALQTLAVSGASGRESRRSGARRPQHGHGAGPLLRSSGGSRGAGRPVRALWKRAEDGGRGQPPAGGETGQPKGREHPATPDSQGSAMERAAFPWMEEIPSQAWTGKHWELPPAVMVGDLAEELRSNRNLLAALAGPSIEVKVDIERGGLPVRLTGEDLTRILVNLVKNSIEAMPSGGRIRLVLRESLPEPGADPWLTLNIEDNGPGIPTPGSGEHLRTRIYHSLKGRCRQRKSRLEKRTSRARPLHHPLHRGGGGWADSSRQPRPLRRLLPDRAARRNLPKRLRSHARKPPGIR